MIALSVQPGIYEDQRKYNPAACQPEQGICVPFPVPGIFAGEWNEDHIQYQPYGSHIISSKQV
jgi:hypothetical protein